MNRPEKIRITPDMIINDMGIERPDNFFCEFDKIGDPKYGEATAPEVHPRYDHWWIGQTDLCFHVCFPGSYYIDSIYFYNNYEGTNEARVQAGTPFAWSYNEKFMVESRKWCGFDVGQTTEFLHFEFNNNVAPSEIVIYGYKVADKDMSVPERGVHPMPENLMKFFGINAFINDAMDVCSVSNYVREYHPWLWTLNPEGDEADIRTNPANNNGWMFDDYYGTLHSIGVDVAPTITWSSNTSIKKKGVDPQNPAAYHKYAEMLFQYVARFGRNKDIDPAKIKVGPGQEVKIGLGYMTAIEPLNEPDGTWLGREPYFTPFELCAFLSMCYDGHEGMYPDVGVKQADPSCTMSMSGGAGLNLNHLRAMQFWAKYNRKDGRLPFDVINAHRYCGKYVDRAGIERKVDVNIDERGDTKEKVYVGISPDEGKVADAFDSIREFRDRYYPEMEIWLTEFGWDTNQSYKTATSAHAYGEYTGRQVQAMWLIREYLLLSSIGIERAAMYMSRDCGPEETSVGKYGTSGLVCFPIEKNPAFVIQGNKKDSYYYLYTVKDLLQATRFDGEVESHNANVRIFRYHHPDGKKIYALWCVTSDGTKIPGLELTLEGAEKAKLVELIHQSITGRRSDLEVKDGKVFVNVSENPVFVIAE